MKTNKPKAVGRSLADLKKLQGQVRQDLNPPPAPARPQARKRPRPPDPGGKPAKPAAAKSVAAVAEDPVSLLDPSDRAWLRQSMRDVAPLKKRGQNVVLSRPAASPEQLEQRRRHAIGAPVNAPALPQASDQYVSVQGESNDLRHLRAGCGTDVLRDLERNRWPIESSLDLHGSDLEQARERFSAAGVAAQVIERLKSYRIDPLPGSVADLTSVVGRELPQYLKLAADTGLKLD